MSFGTNLQYLRSMYDALTQERLAEKMSVSRQTVSKWEQDEAYPTIEKLIELCDFFSCTLDQILRGDLTKTNKSYSEVRIEMLDRFRLARHAVISVTPEDDAMLVIRQWSEKSGLAALTNSKPDIIGWDFPLLSPEQINVFNMRGYVAACVIPADFTPACEGTELVWQDGGKYAVISITEPFRAAFELIPNAYKTILRYIKEHDYSLRPENQQETFCFERIRVSEGIEYMDIFLAIE